MAEVRALRERASEAVAATEPAKFTFSREHYEIACAAAGVEPLSDEQCDTREVLYGTFRPPEYDVRGVVQMGLARERAGGLVRERRKARREFRAELDRRFFAGLTREGYETVCAEVGLEPLPDDELYQVNGEYQQRVEYEDLVPLHLELGAMRFSALVVEKRRANP